MENGKMLRGMLVSALMLAPAYAQVPVPNHSFETPVVDNPFNATAALDQWLKSAIPQYVEASGTFKNVDQTDPDNLPDIDNTDGIQGAFLFSAPFNEIYQDLVATYQVGSTYSLIVGAEGGGANMALNEPLLMILYYRDPNQAPNDRIPISFTTILNNNPPSQTITHLDDWTLNIPAVQPGDAWAGKNIGIQFLAPETATGGYWDLDNVRLVPEPAGAAVLALASLVLARRRS